MVQQNTARHLVDILAAGPGGAHELLLDVFFAYIESRHALDQLAFFFSGNWKTSHRKFNLHF
jgi:hypothetical protein